MKKQFIDGCPVWASIYDGFSHFDRRVYVNEEGKRFVKINNNYVDMDWVDTHWEAYIYF